MFILFWCSFGFRVFFIWLDPAISMVSKLFDLILLRVFRIFLFQGGFHSSVSISLNLLSISINAILDLCLLDSFFQGDLFLGLAVDFHCYPIFLVGDSWGMVVIVGMLEVCCLGWVFIWFIFWGLQLCWSRVGGFSLDLVQHEAWLSGWSSFFSVILIVFSVLLLDLSSQWAFLGFGLSCSWVWLHLYQIYFLYVWLLIFFLFSIFHILLSQLHDFVCSLYTFVVAYSMWFTWISLQFLHAGGLVRFSLWCPNFWQLWHLSGFCMYIFQF